MMSMSFSYTGCLLLSLTSYVTADFVMNIKLSEERINEGGSVTATCELLITNKDATITPAAWTVVWVKRTIDGEEVEIASEREVSERFARTGRYAARKSNPDSSNRLRYVYTLTITGQYSR